MRLTSHGQLWEYKRKIESELGERAGDAWARAVEMHVCFYENWCNKDDVEKALKSIKKLVKTIAQKNTLTLPPKESPPAHTY